MILLQKKKLKFRAGELVQWLKVLTKCPGLVPSERIKKESKVGIFWALPRYVTKQTCQVQQN